MCKKIFFVTIISGLFTFFHLCQADNLIEVYHQALVSDPTFKKAEADWKSEKLNSSLALTGSGAAGSGLFPNIDAKVNINHTNQRITDRCSGLITNNDFSGGRSYDYSIRLTQPIFDIATWKSIASASYAEKAATARYLAAAQDLISRVTYAYFAILQANSQLRFTLAKEQSFLHQLNTMHEKFKVGLIAITAVYDAKASYDAAVADEIKDRNNLENQIENLRAITGKSYVSLVGLKPKISLLFPTPNNIERWVIIAERQNYSIQAARNTMLAQRKKISLIASRRYPTLTASGSYISEYTASAPKTVTRKSQVALNLNFPIFQGGFLFVKTRQAAFNYWSASDQLEFTHRYVVNQTRQAFLGVQSGISQIKADKQAIISAKNKLDATRAGYRLGTRTMDEVLNSVADLYRIQKSYANDRFAYILSIVRLKQEAGTLSYKDLEKINSWLKIRFYFSRHGHGMVQEETA